jgi:hypothetical protein
MRERSSGFSGSAVARSLDSPEPGLSGRGQDPDPDLKAGQVAAPAGDNCLKDLEVVG